MCSPAYASEPITHLPTNEPIVALTFDDGPDPVYTPKVLAILKEKQVHATFFLVGEKIDASPQLAAATLADGHTLGNHSWNHLNYSWLGNTNILKDIRDSQKAFKSATGIFPIYFRPPFGAYKAGQLSILEKYYRAIVLWSGDGLDYKDGATIDQVVQNINSALQPGAILLFHDSNPVIVGALPQIIDEIHAKGYQCVSLGEFFGQDQF